ncbi:Phytoene desaturase (lycopene-forming) [Posidoniimonas polymericola]|uniref:Pyridine nucleotide-disulfide oxidoreductase domain-containing protein 2 n=1 Tax=Posidoniimonas polymericola TaxID=2528002 RepID=A0A5C5YTR4_9BACT|nr:NAD(P)/FAD-dependent oxidoreductase [Posidoniimonas polymericola]TWT78190.1 Phytoene desaturase (lycopene-forming) [Posidoniimonas polymericola]
MAASSTAYDAVIIGGGHNGLVCACYLARAGKKVCVLERRHVLGGCATTEELWPGYKVSTAAYVISLFLPQIISELKLKEHGLEILPRRPSSFTPLPDGRSLLMGPDAELCHRELSQFSTRDAEQYPKYEALLERVAAVLEPVLSEASPDPLPLPTSWRKVGIPKKMRDIKKGWSMYQAAASLGDDMPAAIELLTGPARPILERWFESEVLKATLATDAIIGAFTSISSPGSAYVLLHHVMGEAGGARGVWGYVRGGMGALSEALASAGRELGVEVRRESPVASINTSGGKAVGVTLEDGTVIDAPVVGSSVDAHLTFEKFLQPADLPDSFRTAVSNIDYSSASMKVNLALSEPPNFTARPTDPGAHRGVMPHHHGTMHIGPTMDYLERAYDDAKYGLPAEEPILEMTMATSVDESIAPAGKHILSMFVQYAPYMLSPEGGVGPKSPDGWDAIKDDFADRCVRKLAEYAPNVPDAIEHRQVLSPLDLERTYGITGGNIMQGAMNANQLYCFRPVPGWSDHRTPVNGLYLCGAASHPGGGVMGACGKNAADEILRDGRWG